MHERGEWKRQVWLVNQLVSNNHDRPANVWLNQSQIPQTKQNTSHFLILHVSEVAHRLRTTELTSEQTGPEALIKPESLSTYAPYR